MTTVFMSFRSIIWSNLVLFCSPLCIIHISIIGSIKFLKGGAKNAQMSLGLLLCGPVNCPVVRYKRGHGTDLHALSNLSLMSMGL